MIYIVCVCLCVRDREKGHMWLPSVFLLGLPHSLPSRMTVSDIFRVCQNTLLPGLCPLPCKNKASSEVRFDQRIEYCRSIRGSDVSEWVFLCVDLLLCQLMGQ